MDYPAAMVSESGRACTSVPVEQLASVRYYRFLCVTNGGLAKSCGKLWTNQTNGYFVREMSKFVGEVCLCNWAAEHGDPLLQTDLGTIQGVRTLALNPIHGNFLGKSWRAIRALFQVLREIRQARFAYLFCPGGLPKAVGHLCQVLRKPYGIYLRGEVGISSRGWQKVFRGAQFILTTGDLLRKIANTQCTDVENVTPMVSFRPEDILAPQAARSVGPWNLLYVGRIEERKGMNDLIQATKRLSEQGVDFKLTLVGHCNDHPGLIAQLPPAFAQRIRFAGVVTDFERLVIFYREADLFVFPSHDEGFPRVLYEAMAFGVPIVTTFVGSIPAVMRDGENCLRTEAKDPADLAEKIRLLLESQNMRTRFAASGHECVSALAKNWQRSHAVQILERLCRLETNQCL